MRIIFAEHNHECIHEYTTPIIRRYGSDSWVVIICEDCGKEVGSLEEVLTIRVYNLVYEPQTSFAH
jgi:hypothetical protein